jgi:RND family efflux transporter MFP subunit
MKSVVLATDRPGVIASVANEGDKVAKDQVVAELNAESARAREAVARETAANDINTRFARKAAEVAAKEYAQAQEANRLVSGAVAVTEVERLRLTAQKSELQIEQAEHEQLVNRHRHTEAKAELAAHQVAAPFAGIVTKRYKSVGEAVRQGDPILELKSTDRVRVEGFVGFNQLAALKPGQKVQVQLDVPGAPAEIEGKKFEGTLAFIDVEVEPATFKGRVWADVENKDGLLRGGLTARMTILPDAASK